jgi:hypothetical protein
LCVICDPAVQKPGRREDHGLADDANVEKPDRRHSRGVVDDLLLAFACAPAIPVPFEILIAYLDPAKEEQPPDQHPQRVADHPRPPGPAIPVVRDSGSYSPGA